MKIIPLSEGAFTIDHTKRFVPFDLKADNLQQRPTGSLLVEVQPFVVITRNDIILLDTGLGFRDVNGILQIHQNLSDAGINPLDVTRVIMSHLHKDHAGGIASKDLITGAYQLNFPSATYYVQARELQYALDKGEPSYIPDELRPLEGTDKVVLLDGDKGDIAPGIRYWVTGGHSPYHQVLWLEEDGQIVFFGGDDAPQLSQMKNRFVAKYDYDGKKCMELRKQWWQEGGDGHWTFLFYHDVKYPTVSL
ncbi:MAG TPA: MBL fold metallo-hydrolase [Dinghuibacter sp.]|jgi:glyoxylase-like metal-dependent hydrolase (beta-lactamase superfamily II)|uniref:MBL fold metallo-hydrolase n=1 Tax=Dinghuibacter sp. TaxID=2024697 RepID=UPI002C0D3FA7|nr:MBL fold metallo-hydrolase [Dinghuibacter sp.]HTJ14139.1 MBL fold metallo-hydrolase [Dinghuibacter sp.]